VSLTEVIYLYKSRINNMAFLINFSFQEFMVFLINFLFKNLSCLPVLPTTNKGVLLFLFYCRQVFSRRNV